MKNLSKLLTGIQLHLQVEFSNNKAMQKVHFLHYITIILLVLLLFTACNRKQTEILLPQLIHAESVIYQHPDSALIILKQMPMPKASDKLQHATWCLLMTQAQHKIENKMQSDSLINIAFDHFMLQNNPQRKALALYFAGVLSEQRKEAEMATMYYLDASAEVEKTKDYQLAHLIYNKLGMIYLYRKLNQYAEETLLKGLDYAKISGNYIYISSSLSSIARLYSITKETEKAINSYKGAIAAAKKTNNSFVLSAALSELSAIYTITKEYPLALSHIQEAINIKKDGKLKMEQSFLNIGDLYRRIGQNDSAYFYLQKSLNTDNIYTQCSAYQALYNLSINKKITTDRLNF